MKKLKVKYLIFPLFMLVFIAAQFPGFGQAETAMGSDKKTNAKQDSTKKDIIKAYSELITAEAESMEGLFSVHKIKNKYYFEIPDSIFGRDIMAITRMAKTPTGAGYGGELGNKQVIRFEKGPDKNVFIRVVSYINVSADTIQALSIAIENSNVQPIAAAFKIASIRKDTSVVIDVTKFFNKPNQAFDLPVFSKQRYNIKGIAKDRSYIESIKAFPINVEVRTVRTYSVAAPKLNKNPMMPPSRSINLMGGIQAGVVTFELNTSMILLPEKPMRRRFFDPRVGIFANRYTTFDESGQRAKRETFTVRRRLEAKNEADVKRQQAGETVEPQKPIVFYIDPATPEKWRPYIKQGIEDWQPAFEQAGWKNAILAKDWPVDNPDMSLEDARFSVVRYFASTVQNAYGPNVHDPRSGEILESHIGWFHNITKLLKRWYTIQTGAVDLRARHNKFDDELMGELIRFVSAHEVGHTIGLRHNFGASNATPVEKLRDKAFTDANGHTTSIMDYARFNYVAQPGDGVTDFFPRIGDYDKWAIEWNYKPIYNTKDEYEDKKILNQWYMDRAEGNVRLRFLTESNSYDPRSQSEDLGDNAVLASEYGIKNLKRILPNAINWTKEDGEDYELAKELYDDVFGQYRRYVGHVLKWVGGVYETPRFYEQDGLVYEPAPADRQREAMSFLNKQLFQTPVWLIEPAILNTFRPDQGVAKISGLQKAALASLFNASRLQRMIETETTFPDTYGIEEMYADIYKSIWSELDGGKAISTYRRNLQKIYLEQMIRMVTPKVTKAPTSSFRMGKPAIDRKMTDIISISRGHLKKLHKDLKKKSKRFKDAMTVYHLEDCKARIEKALEM